MFEYLINNLTQRLQQPLPGETVQMQMSPPQRFNPMFPQQPNDQTRKGGVLILLYPHDNKICFPLMQRVEDGSPHSGQISFPGGTAEPYDANMIQTALRETHEEFGVPATDVTVLGSLSTLFIPVSNFLVYPAIGYMQQRPTFTPDYKEVQQIIETDIEHITAAQTRQHGTVKVRNFSFEVPYFDVQGHKVWGATAIMLSEFCQVITDALKR